MHPVIKITCVLILLGFASQAKPFVLLASVMVLIASHVALANVSWRHALRMLKRLRIFFISILLIYGWFTPGTPVIVVEYLQALIPVQEGLIEGAYRISALCIMIWAVSYLLQSTSSNELIAALVWFFRPLSVFDNLHERLALRMTLVLQSVDKVSELISSQRDQLKTGKNRITQLVDAIGGGFQSGLERAETQREETIIIHIAEAPAWKAWLLPLGLLLMLLGVSHYV